MATQTTRTALRHLEKAEFLVTSIRTHQPTVNASLAEVGPDLLPGEDGTAPPIPDWDALQSYNVALLESSAAAVRLTDHEHRHLLVHAKRLSAQRSEQVELLRTGHRDLRKTFTGTYGAESLPLVGLDAEPARASLAVREQLKEVVERMRDPEMVAGLGEPRAKQAPIDLEGLADAQEGNVRELEATLAEIKQTRKHRDESLVLKRDTQAQHRRVYVNVARVQEGLYRLAGLDELADRIRFNARSSRPKPKADTGEPRQQEPGSEPNDPQVEPQPSDEPPDASPATSPDASPATSPSLDVHPRP